MTKLNYANRKSEGVKCGSSVAKDLRRRTRTPGAATAVHSPIDLNLNNKHLTDDGVFEFAETLGEVLTPVAGAAPAKLQFLHLQQNQLTARSLALLAPCIEAARDTLEELDLSGNQITIVTEEDKTHWRGFLAAFGRCTVLRQLNLSFNDLSNFQALEIFADVYIRQFDANKHCWEADLEAENELAHGVEALSVRDMNVSNASSSHDKQHPENPNTNLIRGLPGIPLIDFHAVSMSDGGALFLTWIIERHKYAQVDHSRRLWLRSKDEPDGAGMDVSENKTLGPLGIKLLCEAETVPFHPFKREEENDEDEDLTSGPRRRSSGMTPASRRTSGSTINRRRLSVSESGEPHSMPSLHRTSSFADLRNARRRVQRSIIEIHGVQSVKLWHAALRLLPLVRQIMLKESQVTDVTPLRLDKQDSIVNPFLPAEEPSPPPSPAPATPAPATPPPPAPTYASKLLFERTRGAPVLSIIGETRVPTSPPAVLKPKDHPRRRSGSMQASPPPSATSAPKTAGPATLTLATPLKGAIEMGQSLPRMVGPLSEQAWIRVLVFLIGAEDILKEAHIQSVLEYACDRKTLAQEREYMGKSDSVQKWKVLEQMQCLMY